MNKLKRQQKTNEFFIKELAAELEEWCKIKEIEPSIEAFLAYMVKHNLLRQSVINQYVAIHAYPMYIEAETSKEKAVAAMTQLLPLEDRQVWNLLSNHYTKFRPNGFKFP